MPKLRMHSQVILIMNHEFSNEALKGMIYCPLKHGSRIFQSKRHYVEGIGSPQSGERSFVHIFFCHKNLILL